MKFQLPSLQILQCSYPKIFPMVHVQAPSTSHQGSTFDPLSLLSNSTLRLQLHAARVLSLFCWRTGIK